MQDLLEKRLLHIHETGTTANFKHKCIAAFSALTFIFLVPFFHFGCIYYIWAPDKPTPNRGSCTCECFDTVFRGRYEWPPSNYKHFYFNSTANTLKIWFVTVLGVLVCYECVKHITVLFIKRSVRIAMFALLVASCYSHYYGWWGLIQYLNEEYWSQWYHQLFFSLTELASSAVVLHLCNKEVKVEPWKLLIIFNINLMHIVIGALDQFVENVVQGRGQVFESVRDIGLMIPDVFHVLVCYFETRILADSKRVSMFRLFYKEELMVSCLLVTLFTIMGKNM